MEYKYHPIIKYLTFFVIVYLFLRHQTLMKNEILLANTLVISMYYIVLDYLFISQHHNILSTETEQYFDENEIDSIKEDIEKDKEKERKEKKKEKRRKKKEEKKNEDIINIQAQLDNDMIHEAQFINNNHPSQTSAQCKNHAEYVDIYNSLDNYKTHNYNQYEENSYPDYMAYNE
jgi:hypothetical protein